MVFFLIWLLLKMFFDDNLTQEEYNKIIEIHENSLNEQTNYDIFMKCATQLLY